MSDKPRAYFKHILAMDSETSGLALKADDPSYDPIREVEYQALSWGLIVADATTFEPVEEYYCEIKWNGDAEWSKQAESVHGLSLEYLEENGIDEEQAVVEIANLMLKYWGPDSYIRSLGHNVATFDTWFMRRMMRRHGVEVSFGNRHVDSSSIGLVNFGTYNSDDLFEELGIVRGQHNALEDARASLEVCRLSRLAFKAALGE